MIYILYILLYGINNHCHRFSSRCFSKVRNKNEARKIVTGVKYNSPSCTDRCICSLLYFAVQIGRHNIRIPSCMTYQNIWISQSFLLQLVETVFGEPLPINPL